MSILTFFQSGQREVNYLLKLLKKRFPAKCVNDLNSKREHKIKRKVRGKSRLVKEKNSYEVVDYDEFSFFDMDDDSEDFEKIVPEDVPDISANLPTLHCLPLYSLLPKQLQRKVFEERSDNDDGPRFILLFLL